MSITEQYIDEFQDFQNYLHDLSRQIQDTTNEDLDFPKIVHQLEEKGYNTYHIVGIDPSVFSLLATTGLNDDAVIDKDKKASVFLRGLKAIDSAAQGQIKWIQGIQQEINICYPDSEQDDLDLIQQIRQDFSDYHDITLRASIKLRKTSINKFGYEPALSMIRPFNHSHNSSIKEHNTKILGMLGELINKYSPTMAKNEVIDSLKQMSELGSTMASRHEEAYKILHYLFRDPERKQMKSQIHKSDNPMSDFFDDED